MNRKNKEYESNQERNYKHKPYGVKGSGWSSKDNAIVYFMDKKFARQKGNKEIKSQIKDNY